MDESFDTAQSGVFVVGGIMGRGHDIFELERKWEALRKRSDINIRCFKASNCEHGKDEFAKFVADPGNITTEDRARLRSISQEFVSLVAAQSLTVQGLGIVQDDFYAAIQDTEARAILGDDPYRLAYDLAMIQCAWAMKQLGGGDLVAFVCDEHERYGKLAAESYRNPKETNPSAASYMASFATADDRSCEPLQAADAVAFEIRRALKSALGQWRSELRQHFKILGDSHRMFLVQHTQKEHLLHIVATHDPGEPFRLDGIMDQQFAEDVRLPDR